MRDFDSTRLPSRVHERNAQVVRQWEILITLQAGSRTVPELAQQFATTRRTIYRDLDALQAARFALYNERHADGAIRWHLLGGNSIPARRAA